MEKGSKKSEGLRELGVYFLNEEKKSITSLQQVISTGSRFLDRALGVGGWPLGKIIEVFGADSSGKTTLALHAVSEFQRAEKTVVYMDLENTFNAIWAKKIGVNLDTMLISRPANGEQAFDLLNKLIVRDDIDLIVVDSVAALVPTYEFENNIEDQTMGLHARLMSKGLRVLQALMIKSNTTIIFINQIRDKIGNSFVPTTVTTGGRALRYASCIRVEIRRCESIRDSNNDVIGFSTKCTVVKNKCGAPMTSAPTAIYFDSGFDACHEIIHELLERKVLSKKGAWFSMDDKNIAQGMNQLREKMKTSPEFFEELRKRAFGKN